MDDLISRESMIGELRQMYNAARKWYDDAPKNSETEVRAESCMAAVIEMKLRAENMPSVQRTGRWITDAAEYYGMLNERWLTVDEYTPYFTDDIACSQCLAKYNIFDNETQFFKHCPNCGARMESE